MPEREIVYTGTNKDVVCLKQMEDASEHRFVLEVIRLKRQRLHEHRENLEQTV